MGAGARGGGWQVFGGAFYGPGRPQDLGWGGWFLGIVGDSNLIRVRS